LEKRRLILRVLALGGGMPDSRLRLILGVAVGIVGWLRAQLLAAGGALSLLAAALRTRVLAAGASLGIGGGGGARR